jgi:hypothetical protein
MGKEKEFENILNDCLDRLMRGEDIESCLAQYPEYAAQLEPLLKTALETRTIAEIKPSPEFRQRAGVEFQKAIAEMPSKAPCRSFKWQLRWVIPVAVFLVIFSGGAGTVIAATNALPGSPLYPIKMAVESVQLAFTFSDEGKAELYTIFVDYRVEEIIKMAEEGKIEYVEQATERMNSQLLAMADLNIGGVILAEEKAMLAMGSADNALQAPATTTPATTTTTPATTTVPAITAPTAQPPPVVIAAPSEPGRDTATYEETGTLSDIDELKQLLWERYQQNLAILLEQLEKAPEPLKPALLEAIKVLEDGYQLAISSLG